jgi:hypothetical protein
MIMIMITPRQLDVILQYHTYTLHTIYMSYLFVDLHTHIVFLSKWSAN